MNLIHLSDDQLRQEEANLAALETRVKERLASVRVELVQRVLDAQYRPARSR